MRGRYSCVRKEHPVVLELLHPLHIDNRVTLCLDVGIPGAVIDLMAHFLAAVALEVLGLLLLASIAGTVIVVVILLALMLGENTAAMVLVAVTTAPPHPNVITIRVNMLLATPVEILLFAELVVALHAGLDAQVHLAFTALQFYEPLLHFVPFTQQVFALFLEFHQGIALLFQFVRQLLVVLGQPVLDLFRLERK